MMSPHAGLKIITKLILAGDFVVKIHNVDVGKSFLNGLDRPRTTTWVCQGIVHCIEK